MLTILAKLSILNVYEVLVTPLGALLKCSVFKEYKSLNIKAKILRKKEC